MSVHILIRCDEPGCFKTYEFHNLAMIHYSLVPFK